MKISVVPQPEQIQELMKGSQDTPVVMVNLLSFKAEADGGNEGMTGAESYMLYGGKMREFVESKGLLYIGTGVSGGEEGALLGPSIMPGGSPEAWPAVREIFQKISAQTDAGEPRFSGIPEAVTVQIQPDDVADRTGRRR